MPTDVKAAASTILISLVVNSLKGKGWDSCDPYAEGCCRHQMLVAFEPGPPAGRGDSCEVQGSENAPSTHLSLSMISLHGQQLPATGVKITPSTDFLLSRLSMNFLQACERLCAACSSTPAALVLMFRVQAATEFQP